VIYDDNHVTIDGPTELALTDDAIARFTAYGWHVVDAGDVGDDLDAIDAALGAAEAVDDRPSLVVFRTHIGAPSPTLTDAPSAHGLAFGAAEITATKAVMGIPDEPFFVSDDVAALYRAAGARGGAARTAWETSLPAALGERAAEWTPRCRTVRSPAGPRRCRPSRSATSVATRSALAKALTAAVPGVPGLTAGSADLTSNTGTQLGGASPFTPDDATGRQIHFGVREHAMGAVMNGSPCTGASCRSAARSWCSATTCARRFASRRSCRPM
jgi:transketolase